MYRDLSNHTNPNPKKTPKPSPLTRQSTWKTTNLTTKSKTCSESKRNCTCTSN